jgi:hypothetical protein|tara:strand:+ start:38239 stop:39783 length:1545 start_codon:yes stop_codon:yes gene_type:complete
MKRILLFFIGISVSVHLHAQDGESPISYQSLAIQMSTINTNGDAQSAVIPSVSSFNGFGSFLDNPAAMALSDKSFYSIGWLNQSNNKEDIYLGNSTNNEYSNTEFANLGLVYKVPTEKGSFVIGGGYNIISVVNDESFIDGFNNSSSITDAFADQGSGYEDIAFNAFATDFRNETSNEIVSILRVDDRPSGFGGISQFADISNTKNTSDISVFTATEFRKNLLVGVSLGFLTGSINYDRSFQELDETNLYSDGAIPASGSNPSTDIHSIELTERLDTEYYGFIARAGFIYEVNPSLNIGASLALPSKLFVTENYFSAIETEFDDGTFTEDSDDFPTSLSSEFKYAVTKPAEFKVGATLKDIGNLSISASAEYISYSSTKIDFTIDTGGMEPSEVAILKDDEEAINSIISDTYNDVVNLKIGASYLFSNQAKLFGGYEFHPEKENVFTFEEVVYSAGLSFPLSNNIDLNLSGQYSNRDDRSILYEFFNDSGQVTKSEILKSIERINFHAGLKFSF